MNNTKGHQSHQASILLVIMLTTISLSTFTHQASSEHMFANDKTIFGSSSWVEVSLYIPHAGDRDDFSISLLRPQSWIETCDVHPNKTIQLEIEEMGIQGLAYVISLTPCTFSPDEEDLIVTGCFQSHCHDLIQLSFQETSEIVNCTGNHRFLLHPETSWVAAQTLQEGQQLVTQHGLVTIQSITSLYGDFTVYNLEIYKDHTYIITSDDIITHNAYVDLPYPESNRALSSVRDILDRLGYEIAPKQVLAVDTLGGISLHFYNKLVTYKHKSYGDVLVPIQTVWMQRSPLYRQRYFEALAQHLTKNTGNTYRVSMQAQRGDIQELIKNLNAREIDRCLQSVPQSRLQKAIQQLPSHMQEAASTRYLQKKSIDTIRKNLCMQYPEADALVQSVRQEMLKDPRLWPFMK